MLRASIVLMAAGTRDLRHFPVYERREQPGADGSVGERRHGLARLLQFGVALRVERWPRAFCLRRPRRELIRRHRVDEKVHVGKAVAAEIERAALVASRI